jgi:putative transposase
MHPRRLQEFDYIGPQAYFLTICTDRRREAFRDVAVVARVRGCFLRTADAYGFEITAYCFMPDHLHALVTAVRDDSDFKKFVAMFKQRSGFNHRRESGGHLWQENYFEHVLRSGEALPPVVGYVLGNPLRAGLVQKCADYPFMGSAKYTVEMLGDYIQTQTLPWG